LLKSAGYSVETFGSSPGFLEVFSGHPCQCLVLDVHMPVMTGLDLERQLRSQGCTSPVVFVTAHDTPQTLQRVREANSRLLIKPFDKKDLLAAIEACLQNRG
jgi:FixJ family two-component response regulator